MKTTTTPFRVTVAAAATVAVCTALGGARAEAAEIILPVDVLLGTYNLDVDADGTAEYTFTRTGSTTPVVDISNNVNTYSNQVAGFVVPPGDPKPGTYASLLHPGELIDDSLSYVGGSSVILSGNTVGNTFGEFYGHSGFAALRFSLPGEAGVHFGFAELHDTSGNLTVVRVGYETEQDTGIVTPGLVPEPGTLALLAAGAAGLLALRRREPTA